MDDQYRILALARSERPRTAEALARGLQSLARREGRDDEGLESLVKWARAAALAQRDGLPLPPPPTREVEG